MDSCLLENGNNSIQRGKNSYEMDFRERNTWESPNQGSTLVPRGTKKMSIATADSCITVRKSY